MSEYVAARPPDDPTAYPVEWHRPDVKGRLYKVWLLGAVLVVIGAASLALTIHRGEHLPWGVQLAGLVSAVLVSAAGPLWVVVTAIRALADPTCLVLRSDGVHFMGRHESFFVFWRDLVKAEYDAESDTLLMRTEDETVRVDSPHFLGLTTDQLVDRVDDIRRRALLGLVRPANVWGNEDRTGGH